MPTIYPYHLAFFGLSGIELLVILVVGLLVIGPRDLPPLVRAVVALWRKLQLLAHEFQTAFEDMANEMDAKKYADEIKNKILDETGAGEAKKILDKETLSEVEIIQQAADHNSKTSVKKKMAKPKRRSQSTTSDKK